MSKTNGFVFIVLHVIAWLIFVGLSIEAGGFLVNFAFSIFKPEFVGNLYQKLDLTHLRQNSEWVFYGVYGFILFIAVLKAYLFYTVIMLLIRLDMAKPFSEFVSKQITRISYYAFAIGIVSFFAREVTNSLNHYGDISQLSSFWTDSEAFIIMSAVIYVIASIFKKGVELQNENDLTV